MQGRIFCWTSGYRILYTVQIVNRQLPGGCAVRSIVLGAVLALFILCFLAIIIEETMLGGRRRRKMEKELKEKRKDADYTKSGT